MAIESYETQLERVQTAIGAIESGAQSYTIKDRELTRADLETLYNRERFLRGAVAREGKGALSFTGATYTND